MVEQHMLWDQGDQYFPTPTNRIKKTLNLVVPQFPYLCKTSVTIPISEVFLLRIKQDNVMKTIRTESNTIRSFLGTGGRSIFCFLLPFHCTIFSCCLASLCSPGAQGVQLFAVDPCSDLSSTAHYTPKCLTSLLPQLRLLY